jgi:O-antigen ligase
MELAGTLLLLAAFIQPLHLPPWVSWHSEVLAFSSAVLLLGGLIRNSVKQSDLKVQVPNIFWPFGLLLLAVAMQYWDGRILFFGDALVLALYLLLCVSMLIVGFSAASLHTLAWLLLIASVVSVLISLVQTMDVWEFASWVVRPPELRRPGANLGQPNQLATLELMGVASLIFLFESKKLSNALAGFLTALLLWGVVITESRTGVVSLLLLGTWMLLTNKAVLRQTGMTAVIVIVVAFFVGLVAWPPLFAVIHSGGAVWEITGQHVNVSAGSRLIVWPQLLDAVAQRPWFGWGLREVSQAQNSVLDIYATSEPFTYAHNLLLDLAVGLGIPVTVLLVLTTTIWVFRRIGAVKTLLPWYCVALVLPVAVHSMLEFPFAYSYFLIPVMIAIGALERSLSPGQPIRIPIWLIVSMLIGFSAILVRGAWEYIQVEEDFRIARFESLRIGTTPADYQRPNLVLLSQLDALLKGARIHPTPGMAPSIIELARRTALRYPWTATQNRYALTLALNNYPDEARRQMEVMRVMHGEKAFKGILENWQFLADSKYPQLREFLKP